MSKVIEMRGIEKSFFIGKPHELHILKGIDFDVIEIGRASCRERV